jgi:hypothetical protein
VRKYPHFLRKRNIANCFLKFHGSHLYFRSKQSIAVRAARKPNSVSGWGYPLTGRRSFIFGCRLPGTSCDLPGSSNGPFSSAPLFGLSPGGVYKASPVTRRTGALLPHLFTLTPPRGGAVSFLLHFPSRFRDSTLWSTLPCGVRTFLRIVDGTQRSSGLLEPHFLRYQFIKLLDE